jgi:hypothetical protein
MSYDFEDQVLVAQMKQAGFLLPDPTIIPRLFVCTTAMTKRGKSYWAVRAPDPVGVLAFDAGTEHQVKAAIREGRRVYHQKFEVKKADDGGNKDIWKTEFRKVVKAWEALWKNPLIKTGVIDTADELWELHILQSFGSMTPKMSKNDRYSEWGEVNSEFRSVFMDAYNARPDFNIIAIHKTKKEYKENAKGDSNWTGRYERAGFKDMSFMADVNLEHYFDGENKEFGIRILDSRENMVNVVGLEMAGPLNSFNEMAMQVWSQHPLGSKADYWEGKIR